jgi:hypothetical protein
MTMPDESVTSEQSVSGRLYANIYQYDLLYRNQEFRQHVVLLCCSLSAHWVKARLGDFSWHKNSKLSVANVNVASNEFNFGRDIRGGSKVENSGI